MFHMLEKEHAEEVDKKADEQYRKRCNEVLAHSKVLYKTRQEAMEQLKACDAYMQASRTVRQSLVERAKRYRRAIKTLKRNWKKFRKRSKRAEKAQWIRR